LWKQRWAKKPPQRCRHPSETRKALRYPQGSRLWSIASAAVVVASASVVTAAATIVAAATATVVASATIASATAKEDDQDDNPPAAVVISEHDIHLTRMILYGRGHGIRRRRRYVTYYETGRRMVPSKPGTEVFMSEDKRNFDRFFEETDENGSEEDRDSAGGLDDFSAFFAEDTAHGGIRNSRESSGQEQNAGGNLFPPPPPEDDGGAAPAGNTDSLKSGASNQNGASAQRISGRAAPEQKEPPKNPEGRQAVPSRETAGKSAARPGGSGRRRRRSTGLSGLITVLWVAGVLAASVYLSIFAITSINDLVGFEKKSQEIEVTIPDGATLSEIADLLTEKGVIDEPFAFEVYARVKNMQNRLYAGTYTLNSNLGYDQIFLALRASEYEVQEVSVTIYEGMTAREIAELLEEKGVCDADEFMDVVDSGEYGYDFESQMGTDPLIYHKWEGYLFPDTYNFYLDEKPSSVVMKMVSNFNNKVTSSYYDRMQELGLSLEDTITLASIIQAEAGARTDMETISSVFHNRLADPSDYPNLESDVTYFYYRDEIFGDEKITSSEQQDAYHEAYDTYYCLGLPVGPICNPGLDAIEAALYPASTNYYFFVTDDLGNFYYAATLEEHEANVAYADAVNASVEEESSGTESAG